MARSMKMAGLAITLLIFGLIAGYLIGSEAQPSIITIHETFTETRISTLTLTISHVKTTTTLAFEAPSMRAVKAVCITRLMGGCMNILIDMISRANESIHVMIYGFTLDALADALIRAAERGVDVKVLIKAESAGWKGSEHEELIAHGVDVKMDSNPDLMHHKVMVIDGRIVVTGSYNWTWSAEKNNDENILVVEDPGVAAIYEREFQRLWSHGLTP